MTVIWRDNTVSNSQWSETLHPHKGHKDKVFGQEARLLA